MRQRGRDKKCFYQFFHQIFLLFWNAACLPVSCRHLSGDLRPSTLNSWLQMKFWVTASGAAASFGQPCVWPQTLYQHMWCTTLLKLTNHKELNAEGGFPRTCQQEGITGLKMMNVGKPPVMWKELNSRFWPVNGIILTSQISVESVCYLEKINGNEASGQTASH